MNKYESTIDFLFNELPVFQHNGASAYKPGLERVFAIAEAFGNPQKRLHTIHVAGTNGKGSTCHTVAAVLQSAGYRTGLFTSPHLVDFRERIRVNGHMIPRDRVVEFVERYRNMGLSIEPSFFELTTMMAFDWFAESNVDVAVIEVGLGGRLDSTNIITPDLSIITNISLDHTALLGDTPEAIAEEKAGIMKPGVPVVIGEAEGSVRDVFECRAAMVSAPVVLAMDDKPLCKVERDESGFIYHTRDFGVIRGELCGDCQPLNAATVLISLKLLRDMGYMISDQAVAAGFSKVCALTGLAGRWMRIVDNPLVVCDTGHNPGGWQYISGQLEAFSGMKHIVVGFVGDKDVDTILEMIAGIKCAKLYYTQPSLPRALSAEDLASKALAFGLEGCVCHTVEDAYKKALAEAGEGDMVFIGGSNFVVAELLPFISMR